MPPVVTGYLLLLAFGRRGPIGAVPRTAPSASCSPSTGPARRSPRRSWASRCWSAPSACRSRRSTRGLESAASTLGANRLIVLSVDHAAADAARDPRRGGPVLRPRPRRVRRDHHLRRQHPRRDPDHPDGDLHLYPGAGRRDGGAPARRPSRSPSPSPPSSLPRRWRGASPGGCSGDDDPRRSAASGSANSRSTARLRERRPGDRALRPLRRRQDDAGQPHRRADPPGQRPDRRRRRDAVRHDARHRRPGASPADRLRLPGGPPLSASLGAASTSSTAAASARHGSRWGSLERDRRPARHRPPPDAPAGRPFRRREAARRDSAGRCSPSPRLLLLDEPLAALDEARKAELLPYIERLRDEMQLPIVYVSHSIEEVARIADTMVCSPHGEIVATGPVGDILARSTSAAIPARRKQASSRPRRSPPATRRAGMTLLDHPAGRLSVPLRRRAAGHHRSPARSRPRRRHRRRRARPPVDPQPPRRHRDGDRPRPAADRRGPARRRRRSADREHHRRSAVALDLRSGMPVTALIKSAAFDRMSLGPAEAPSRPAGSGPAIE